MRKEIGTFDSCSSCININNNCCTHFNRINNPLVTLEELEIIKKITNNNDFYINKKSTMLKLKTVGYKCIFYIDNNCSIYNNRPIDCRLFPYDVLIKDNHYYLIKYTDICPKVINNIDNIEILLKKLWPYIKAYINKDNSKMLSKQKYIIIKEIEVGN